MVATLSEGIDYTGELKGPEGPVSLGGSDTEGTIAEPEDVEATLDEALADEPGTPTADCPDAPEEGALECSVSGEGVSGDLTVTPSGGFEWEGQIETPEGPRAISANELP